MTPATRGPEIRPQDESVDEVSRLASNLSDSMMAGILGGSGSHVVQISIVIVVAVALIGYFLFRVVGPGSRGDASAVRTAVNQHDHEMAGAHDGTASDGFVRLVRTWSGIGIGARSEQWDIAIDGIVVGSIANNETVDVAVEPGQRTLRLGSGRHRSIEHSFDVAHDEVVGFSCHGPRLWPQLLVALVRSDLWITLRRE